MEYKAVFDKVISEYSSEVYSDDLKEAREEYAEIAGRIFEDDKSYTVYISFFLEWYVVDRLLKRSNKTPLESYLDKSGSEVTDMEREVCKSFMKSIYGVFEVRSLKKELIVLRNICDRKKYTVVIDHSTDGYCKGDILETRLLPDEDRYRFSSACRFHPSQARRLIEKELKRKWKNNDSDIQEFIMRLGKMSLLWERARNIDIKSIYTW